MGIETVAIAAIGAYSAYSQIQAGKSKAKDAMRQGNFDAQVYEQQASMIENQQKLQERQDNRRAAQVRGSIVSRTAGGGFHLSGSPLAQLMDASTELEYDKAIGQYNLEVQKSFVKTQATRSRYVGEQQARAAKSAGYSNAFSTVLKTGTSLATRGGAI